MLTSSRTGDYEAFLIQQFIPRPARDTYLAARTLNLELARLPETVSNAAIGHMRMQFWRDSIQKVFAGNPPREPICVLFHAALAALAERSADTNPTSLKFWLQRLLNARAQRMENYPYADTAALEDYAENTYSTLMYITLGTIPVHSMEIDHVASHIGKACGIVATIRGIPVLAAPKRQNIHTPLGATMSSRNPILLLPLDIMAEANVKEEDVYRNGPDAPGLRDAVFKVATRAHDHLITAQDLLRSLRLGEKAGHEFEHRGEVGHQYADATHSLKSDEGKRILARAFPVLLEAVPALQFLRNLESNDFDPFRTTRSNWKLPWSIWRALSSKTV